MMRTNYNVEGGDFTKAGNVASCVKKTLKQLNVNAKIIKRVVIALYEAEVNIVAHAYQGHVTIDIDDQYITMLLKDEGPGIEDIDLAMTQGFSTASAKVREMGFGAGMGLPNIKKNVDELTLESEINLGTTLCLKVKLTE
ncbi:ATP-binding protein [Saccharicrinis aurantiacus]|uniref:ATP-binding protein n=1 Tax=Saccharicrinis aurantiacus TaxID=1849719 RepID=UPI002491023E|nr:anti-sigma regulatory factor [Saccharicrinis aurantiacus]